MRVISLVPSLTETLFALGLTEAEIVGITKWCVHPAKRAQAIEKIGGTKDPDLARIRSLRPDLVVANREENRKQDVEALERAGLHVLVTDIRTVGDAAHGVRQLGETIGRAAPAEALARRIEGAIAAVAEVTRGRPTLTYYCPIWRRPWMALSNDTYAASMLNLAGGENPFAAEPERYPAKSPEDAIAAGARVALLPSEPYPFQNKHVPELVAAGFAPERVRLIDGEALTWYGARTPSGVQETLRVMESLRPPAERDPRVTFPR